MRAAHPPAGTAEWASQGFPVVAQRYIAAEVDCANLEVVIPNGRDPFLDGSVLYYSHGTRPELAARDLESQLEWVVLDAASIWPDEAKRWTGWSSCPPPSKRRISPAVDGSS